MHLCYHSPTSSNVCVLLCSHRLCHVYDLLVTMPCSGCAHSGLTKKQNAVNCKGTMWLLLLLLLSYCSLIPSPVCLCQCPVSVLSLSLSLSFFSTLSATAITTTTNINVRGYRCGVAFIIALGTKILPVVKV